MHGKIDKNPQDEEFGSTCVIYNEAHDVPPQQRSSKMTSSNISKSQQLPEEGVTIPKDEKLAEQYDLHFGTTVIDHHGKGNRDPTVKALFVGVGCLVVAAGKYKPS